MGGRGQEALLEAPVEVRGLPVTAAYLAAGGTPVQTDLRDGFFAGKAPGEFNPDATPRTALQGLIAPAGTRFGSDRSIAVGADGLVYRSGGCADCFTLSAAALKIAEPSVAL